MSLIAIGYDTDGGFVSDQYGSWSTFGPRKIYLYSLNNYINISQLNAALYGVCPLQDRVKSLRLGRHDYMQHTEIGKDALR